MLLMLRLRPPFPPPSPSPPPNSNIFCPATRSSTVNLLPSRDRRGRRLCCSPSQLSTPPTPSPSSDFTQELDLLLLLLPDEIRRKLEHHLIDVVMDLGRPPLARFPDGDLLLSDQAITSQDLNHAASKVPVAALEKSRLTFGVLKKFAKL